MLSPSGHSADDYAIKSAVALVSPDEDAVRVSSLHGAKGHEFGTVFVMGAVEGVVPFGSNLDPQSMSSELAVLYVGITRARDLLYLSHAEIDRHGKLNPLFLHRPDCQMVRLCRV